MLAKAYGADVVVGPDGLQRAVRRVTGSHLIGDHLSSGAHVTIDAVGTSDSITQSLHITRPRGRVVLLGMPADVTLDLTGLWHRETELKGAYTYGTEHLGDGRTARTFDLAIETANAVEAERLLSATYPLSDHVDAIAHAADRRPARRRENCLRPAHWRHLMPRPGFVLDVDRSTPPTLFWHGEGFRLEKLPADRSRVIYAPEPHDAIDDVDGAIRTALLTRSTWIRCRRCCSPA